MNNRNGRHRMAKPLDERVKKILKELELDPKECLWDCHGTWVMYHRFIEIAGAKNNIEYDLDEVESNSKDGLVCIKCKAFIDRSGSDTPHVTTYGEASPANNKNAYPYAMAEKRAVDRAILKLLGLHGFIYSEDEMPQKEEKIKVEREIPRDIAEPIPPPRDTRKRGQEEYEAMDDDGKLHVNATAESIKKLYLTGDSDNKRKAYLEHVHGVDGDFKLALWYVLQPQSEIRRSLKQLQTVIDKEEV